MNEFSFSSFLTSNIDVDETYLAELMQNCQHKSYEKNEFLVSAGEICTNVFFVEKGLLRQYSIDDKGKEHIIHFAPERWILNDRESLYYNNPSNYYIDALEDTEVFILTKDMISKLEREVPGFADFNTMLLNNHIRQLQNRINQLLSATAEERYLSFIKMYPDIMLRVPQWMIASYLGITPESLSRVRKDLVKKNFK
ncbi:MAG: Crp/Fnr family transcriptional regulator [Brumimicrobium sp.]|nr:Crp/Fnr family transcriptional regulator [Brumimicrobium sp.]